MYSRVGLKNKSSISSLLLVREVNDDGRKSRKNSRCGRKGDARERISSVVMSREKNATMRHASAKRDTGVVLVPQGMQGREMQRGGGAGTGEGEYVGKGRVSQRCAGVAQGTRYTLCTLWLPRSCALRVLRAGA
jgi:hypothetical protein